VPEQIGENTADVTAPAAEAAQDSPASKSRVRAKKDRAVMDIWIPERLGLRPPRAVEWLRLDLYAQYMLIRAVYYARRA
jgi:hypothetical protein